MFNLRPKKITIIGSNALVGLIVFFLFSGMARRPMKEIERKVTERTGVQVENLKRNSDKEPAKVAAVNLSADQLSLDTSLKIALTHNSEIQATFQELGIARADVWQATLFKNPIFEGFVRFPNHETLENGDPAQNNVELSVSQDFIDVLLMPFKRRVASAEYSAVKLRVTDAILSFVLEVKKAYYTAQAAEQAVMFQKTVLEASEAALELGSRQLKSGNIKALDLAAEQVAYEEAKLEYEKSLAEERLAREPLNRLMGLAGNDASVWKIGSPLHDLPDTDPKLDDLEVRSLTERLDLEAIRQQTKALKRNLTATRLGIVPHAEAGVNTEKEIDGGRITGPAWNVEVPVWDQQLAQGSKAKAQWRQNKFHESAYEIKVQSEVREAVTHLQTARIAVESYRNKIIPEREKILGLYLRDYNYMLTGVYQLLDAKQKEVLARRALIESLRDYWIALAELEKAVGGKLEFEEVRQKPNKKEPMQEPASSEKPAAMDHSHHHGGNQS
jgi:cobalt-zinc-cadmium efflux system outer membrane protein